MSPVRALENLISKALFWSLRQPPPGTFVLRADEATREALRELRSKDIAAADPLGRRPRRSARWRVR